MLVYEHSDLVYNFVPKAKDREGVKIEKYDINFELLRGSKLKCNSSIE